MAIYPNLPNQLTLLRLVLAAAFFLVLNQYRYGATTADGVLVDQTLILFGAIVLFICAAVTDWADGYLARKWKVESQFGRIMDPFCDKVLVMGAFIYLCGPRFVDLEAVSSGQKIFGLIRGNMVSGVYPWMVAVILARELFVTGIRGELESAGHKFGAKLFGKLKMVLQSVAIPLVLLIIWLDPITHPWLGHARNGLVYATVIVTILSGLPYLRGARIAMKTVQRGEASEPEEPDAETIGPTDDK
ncbi:MAG: hypothetical protein GC159_11800 [Phycisphaera sp.]|nr:hypothetical protein [Phycisphaera sp.]